MIKYIKSYYPYLPIVGMALYLTIFSIAADAYTGGSINVPNEKSYSLFNNFLCDIMDPVTKVGNFNPARGLGILSHLILSFTMICFFYLLPEIFDKRGRNFYLIRYLGMFTMTVFIFMYTSYHDIVVTLTGVFGTIALIPFFIELRHYSNRSLKWLAYLCFALSMVVFFIFETKIGFYYLPFLQKVAFLFDMIWVLWVSSLVVRKNRNINMMAI